MMVLSRSHPLTTTIFRDHCAQLLHGELALHTVHAFLGPGGWEPVLGEAESLPPSLQPSTLAPHTSPRVPLGKVCRGQGRESVKKFQLVV